MENKEPIDTLLIKEKVIEDAVITVENLHKSYMVGTQEVKVIKNLNFSISRGDFAMIIGPSGCGKSTLLHILLGLEPPSQGKVTFLGTNLYENSTEDDRSEFRKHNIGMVYQQANWIKSLKVLPNVSFPMTLLGMETIGTIKLSIKLLEELGMREWASFFPSELSGGQQQRVALARALINDPSVIVADEPTGNLDYKAGQNIIELLYNLNMKKNKTILMVTHDLEYLPYAKTAIQMLDGEIVGIYKEPAEKEKLLQSLQYKRINKLIYEKNDERKTGKI